MSDLTVKRCDSLVREYCPDRATCPKWATFLDGSECDEFNRTMTELLKNGKQLLSPFAVRVKELMKADREQRIVVLPCRIGEDVYALCGGPCGHKNDESCIFECDGFDEECEGCDGERSVVKVSFGLDMLPDVGTWIFMTEEEACQALEKWKEGHHDSGRIRSE